MLQVRRPYYNTVSYTLLSIHRLLYWGFYVPSYAECIYSTKCRFSGILDQFSLKKLLWKNNLASNFMKIKVKIQGPV